MDDITPRELRRLGESFLDAKEMPKLDIYSSHAQLDTWPILDTVDALSPRYDAPQTIEAVHEWSPQRDCEPPTFGTAGTESS